MSNAIIAPVYARIALDIASRIANGILHENAKLSGRSVLSSEYGVSPETIRRAVNLLQDVGVLEIKSNSGITVLSQERAKEYVAKHGRYNDLRALRRTFRQILNEQETSIAKIRELADIIADLNEKYTSTNPFQNYEAEIFENSAVIGKSISELKFWQSTGATIVAIRRGEHIILSPGPYMTLMSKDIIVYVGELSCTESVPQFLNNANEKPFSEGNK